MSGWSGGPGGSNPQGADPWGRPAQNQGQGGSNPWGPTPPAGQPAQSPGWQTQPAPTSQPGSGQPGGWQTQTGSQPVPGRPVPPPGWGAPQGAPPQGWGQQPPPGYGRPPAQAPGQPGWGAPPQGAPPQGAPPQGAPPQAPGWGQQPPPGWGQQPPPGWGQPPAQQGQQGQVPTWAQPQQGAAPAVWARSQSGQTPPPAQWGGAPAQASGGGWSPVPSAAMDPDAFPVRVMWDESQGIGRLWGLPGVGVMVRLLLLIPHLVVLWALGMVAAILMYFTWIPVLFMGRQADLVYQLVGGYLRWTARITSYLYLLNSGYPPFSLSGEDDYRVRVEIDRDQRINRFWGIPVIGTLLRAILVIPHAIALLFVGIAAFVLIAFSWVPVLLLGRQAQLVYSVVGGYLRWSLRVSTYLLLLHDRYPPFSLGNEEADRFPG